MGDFTNLLAAPVTIKALVTNLKLAAEWSDGPVALSFDAATEINTASLPLVLVTAKATNSANALHITGFDAAVVSDRNSANVAPAEALVHGRAILPITASGTKSGFSFSLHSNAPIEVKFHTATNHLLRELLATFTKADLRNPSMQVALGGTVSRPQGTIEISADSLALPSITNQPLPELKDLRANIEMSPEMIRLRELRATLFGQSMFATAEVPVADGREWRHRLRSDKAHASVQIPSADLAAFAAFATNVLAPRGMLDVSLALEPGMHLSGHISISNAATARLPNIGPIYDIDAHIQLRDRVAIIERIGAHAAGGPLAITGILDFAQWTPTNRWPETQLRITGTNVALIRESQKVIRSDINLQITNVANATPSIGGTINLREELVSREADGSGAERRHHGTKRASALLQH